MHRPLPPLALRPLSSVQETLPRLTLATNGYRLTTWGKQAKFFINWSVRDSDQARGGPHVPYNRPIALAPFVRYGVRRFTRPGSLGGFDTGLSLARLNA